MGLGRWEKSSAQNFCNLFLKLLTEGAVTTEAVILFQYFTTLTEKADPLVGGGSYLRMPSKSMT